MKTKILVLIFCFSCIYGHSQNTSNTKREIDPSKPTNLYTQINTSLEGSLSDYQDLYGIRMNFQFAFDPDNLLLAELPILYNDRTEKTGLGDLRVRYFNVVQRNLSKKIIALAPFTDITIPTGSFSNGLGGSSWSIALGAVAGIMASPKLSLFPGLSYVHITKPSTKMLPDSLKFSGNGIGFQFNVSYSFNRRTFLFINPTPLLLNTQSNWKTNWSGEFSLNRIVKPNKLKMNISWYPNFTNDIHVVRVGTTFYL